MSRFTISNNYPSDWKCFSFDQLFDFEGGLSISREKLSDEGICYLHYGDIHTSSKNYIDVKKDYEKLPKYNEKLQNINQKYLLNDGDIVIADASEDHEGIGKAVVIFNEEKIPFISGLHTIVAKDKTDLIYRDFKRYFLSDWYIRKQMMFYATGISVFGLSKENVKKIQVILPSKLEQRKIADILSTWDKAIELKEKLIEQKKEQKKGLMQRLLTGKVRLPGFEGEWEEIQVKDVCEIGRGRVISKKEIEQNQGIYPVYSSQTSNNGEIGRINTYDYDGEYITWTTDGVNAGTVFYRKGKFNCTNVCGTLKLLRHDIDARYFSLMLQRETDKYVVRHGNPKLMNNVMAIITVRIFNNYEYQKFICDIFDMADREITLLEQEVEALKQQKKGLMQLLLTGKVRVKC